MNKKRFLCYALIAIFLFSCSSAPKKSNEVNTRKNRAADYSNFGNNYFSNGNYDQALLFFSLAYEENIAADHEPGISRSASSIAKVYLVLGDTFNAASYLDEAYETAKKLSNDELTAISAINLAEYNIIKKNYAEAEKHLDEAFSAARGAPLATAETYHTRSVLEKEKGNSGEALAFLTKAIEINSREKSYASLAANYYMAASVYSKNNEMNKAVEMLELAIKADRNTENSYGLAKDYKALGIVYEKNRLYEEAYENFFKSYRIFNIIENRIETISTLEYLISVSETINKTSTAEAFRKELERISNGQNN